MYLAGSLDSNLHIFKITEIDKKEIKINFRIQNNLTLEQTNQFQWDANNMIEFGFGCNKPKALRVYEKNHKHNCCILLQAFPLKDLTHFPALMAY